MTIALVYRNGDEAFFLHDFRITYLNGKQVDALMKFEIFDKRFGLFFAGDVTAFKGLVPRIRAIAHDVTLNNILEPDGPFGIAMESYMMGNPDGLTGNRTVELLGFIIDDQHNAHECFCVTAQVGMGSLLTKVTQNAVTVIGSARTLPGLSDEMTAIITRVLDKGFDISTALQSARTHIKVIFQRAGPGSYGELGISPALVGSVLVRAHFEMIGEQISGKRFSSDFGPEGGSEPILYDYTLQRTGGTLEHVDNITGKRITVESAEHFTERLSGEVLDPEHLLENFDPTQFANSNGVVYVINQWVDEKSIIRTLEKTHMLGNICNPHYTRLANDTDVVDMTEQARYIRSGDHGLIVQPIDQAAFELGVSQHLFDHAWLSKYVLNYSDLFT